MKIRFLSLSLFVSLMSLLSESIFATDHNDFNKNWRFTLSDSANYSYINYTPDSQWRVVNLPHDWSVELPLDSVLGEGCTGYAQGGVAWYSKEFPTTISENGKCFIVFDGVYNNSEYWINGKSLGTHPYGYSPFYFDVTDFLRPQGKTNRLSVRVDHSHYADSRWYTGSGIYRSVEMVTCDKLYIPVWGTFITTPKVSKDNAQVNIKIDVVNDFDFKRDATLKTILYSSDNKQVAQISTHFSIKAGEKQVILQTVDIKNPQLWGIDSPSLYMAKCEIIAGNKVIGEKTTRFGVRTIKFDADKGFFLNGENMKIKGFCLHHDAGIIGTAFVKDVWKRRLMALKDAGCNAIRSSHNPAADEFLSLCDELGFLVQDEFFDEWDNPKDKRLNMNEKSVDYITRGYGTYFNSWAERDVKSTILRARNHPCIFQWSIGNEIEWTYPGNKEATGFFGADSNGNYFWNIPPYSPQKIKEILNSQPKHTYDISKTAHKLAKWTKEMDTTRPVIANCILPSASFESGYIDALDIAGFSYRRVMYDYAKKNYPKKPIMGTENLGQWHEWKAVIDRDFVPGLFIWTGIDYIGERGNKKFMKYPDRILASGILDICGFKKPSFYMMKSLWREEPLIAIYSLPAEKSSYKVEGNKIVDKEKDAWQHRLWVWDDVNSHWNYKNNEPVIVEIYSNCDNIELFLNNKSLGKHSLNEFPDHIYKWAVDYKQGNLTAKGYKSGKMISSSIVTAGKENSIRLSCDKINLSANGSDVAHIKAQLIDKKSNEISDRERNVEFMVNGDYHLLGIDNGSPMNVSPYNSTKIRTYKGHCLLEIQSKNKPSNVRVQAVSDDLKSNEINITIK